MGSLKLHAIFLVLIIAVGTSNLAFSLLTNNVLIRSTGKILAFETWDNCDQISDWKVPEGDPHIISVDYIDKVEGAASLKMTYSAGWDILFYKDGLWDFSATPVLRFRFKAHGTLPVNFRFAIGDALNTYKYNFRNQTRIGEWVTIEVDLRLPESGFPDLTNIYQVEFSCWDEYIPTSASFNVDFFERLAGPPMPLHVYILPTYTRVLVGEPARFQVFARGGAEPYSIEWHVNNTLRQVDTNIFTFAPIAVGNYVIKCVVADAEETSITLTATLTAATPPPPPTRLHTEGNKIVDESGCQVFLRGVNYGGFGDTSSGGFDNETTYDGYSTFRPDVVRGTFKAMTGFGFNSIRIMIVMDWWIKDFRGHIDFVDGNVIDVPNPAYPSYREVLKETISIANSTGLYVIISVWTADHTTGNGYQTLPFPTNAIPNATVFKQFWLNLTIELNDYPNILYELYNEPVGNQQQFNSYWAAVRDTIIALRNNGYTVPVICHWAYCGGFDWLPEVLTYVGNLSNVIISNHIYRYHGTFDYPPIPSDYNSIRNWLLNELGYGYAMQQNIPILIGEIGCVYGDAEELNTFRNTLQCQNEWGISYQAVFWDPKIALWRLATYPMTNPTLTETGEILVQKIDEGKGA